MHEKLIIYLVGFWPSNRKDKKDKKDEKKRSNNSKPSKIAQIQQQQQHDETSSVNSQNSAYETNDFNKMMGSMDGLNQIPTNITKSKCVIRKIGKLLFCLSFLFLSQHLNLIHNQVHLFHRLV